MFGSEILLLQMNKSACCLDQTFEVIRILGLRPKPKMLEDVVRFVIALLIPAPEESQVTGMVRDIVRISLGWSPV
jgi:hypothetical protein